LVVAVVVLRSVVAGFYISAPNLSLNPDAPPAGARSNILARPPFRRAG